MESEEEEIYDAPVYEAKSIDREYDYEYNSAAEDVWDDDIKQEPYNPPPVNIPEKQKSPEYEEEEAG